MDAKDNVNEFVRKPLVRTLVSDPKILDGKNKEIFSLAKEFDQALDTLSDKCRLLVLIQEAAEKMSQ